MPVGASHADHARRLSAEALVEYGYSLVILAWRRSCCCWRPTGLAPGAGMSVCARGTPKAARRGCGKERRDDGPSCRSRSVVSPRQAGRRPSADRLGGRQGLRALARRLRTCLPQEHRRFRWNDDACNLGCRRQETIPALCLRGEAVTDARSGEHAQDHGRDSPPVMFTQNGGGAPNVILRSSDRQSRRCVSAIADAISAPFCPCARPRDGSVWGGRLCGLRH
jgi:hypothetical protein